MKKRILCLILAAALPLSCFLAMALPVQAGENNESASGQDSPASTPLDDFTKDEVVYSKLSSDGSVQSIYVVNTVYTREAGVVIDYGAYDSVSNLTDESAIRSDNGENILTVPDGTFYYQGNLEARPLPWTYTINYQLDGASVSADQLAGAAGHLSLQIHTAQTPDMEPSFYDNYMMQITVTMDNRLSRNITAPDASIANAGSDKQIVFTALPGKEGKFSLEADVHDFAMDGIMIAAIPFSMAIEMPDTSEMTGDITELSDAIDQLNQGVSDLSGGIRTLLDGSKDLASGSSKYQEGMHKLDANTDKLQAASATIRDALDTISSSLQEQAKEIDLNSLNQLPGALREMSAGLDQAVGGLTQLRDNYKLAYDALVPALDALDDSPLTPEELAFLQSMMTPGPGTGSQLPPELAPLVPILQKLTDTYTSALTAKGTFDAVKEAFGAVDSTLSSLITPLGTISASLGTMADGIGQSLKDNDITLALSQLTTGLSDLSANYSTFHSGLVAYTNGVSDLADAFDTLNQGIGQLADGTAELNKGGGQLKSGTKELFVNTRDLPDRLREEIDKLMEDYDKTDFHPVSFVDGRNKHIEQVQFVVSTPPVDIPVKEAPQTTDSKPQTLWEKFLDLFR
ncbi:hypothetical protein [Diplocloster hominis]|uniref:hypothetical protein n=1 Tax=Diplocloster hominis TaxID=3079010 RepID=UPI0031B9C17A